MEKHIIKNDIKVFYITATSFPDGIKEAYEKLHSLLPTTSGRKFYGISRPEGSKITYKAAVEESYPGEAEKYNCKRLIIPRGEYMSELIHDWQKDETLFRVTFEKLLARPDLDPNGFCAEEYLNERDVRCMVPLHKTATASPN
jgi:hypothetical protein